MVGSDDARVRECEFVELLVDTGATEQSCGPHDFPHAALKNGPRPALKTATGELLKHYGTGTVDRRFAIGNVSLYIVKKDYSYLCMWMT